MKKPIAVIAACAALMLCLAGCTEPDVKDEGEGVPPEQEQVEEEFPADLPLTQLKVEDEGYDAYIQLSEQNRVQNSGTFLVKDGWIYGQSWKDDGSPQFVKVRDDMSDWTVLDDGFATQIYEVDGYLYYMCWKEDGRGIYKMRASGSDKKEIIDAYGQMQIVGDQIYYTNYMVDGEYNDTSSDDSQYHLYRCDLNGENVVEVTKKPTFCWFVFEDGILYQDDRDNISLHICDLNGENDVKLNDTCSFNPLYDGEFIYYRHVEGFGTDNEKEEIWKVRPDGTDDQLVAPYESRGELHMTENHLYFVNVEDGNRLYRIDKDGGNLTLITQDTNVLYVNVFDSRLKYSKYAEDYEYIECNRFCNLDGGGKWEFEK